MQNTIQRLITGGLPLSHGEHKALLDTRRGLYASLLLLPDLGERDAAGIIARLLSTTKERTERDVVREDAIIREVLPRLSHEIVLEVFDKLARARVNNRRTSGWMRAYILGSPQLDKWAVSGRTRLKRLLTHAMGRDTVRTVARFLTREHLLDSRRRTYLRRNLYRYGHDRKTVRRVFLFLMGDMIAGDGPDTREYIRAEYSTMPRLFSYEDAKHNPAGGSELPLRVLKGLSSSYHGSRNSKNLRYIARREKKRRETEQDTENSLTAKVRAALDAAQKEPGTLLREELDARLSSLPMWHERIVVLADTSASMRGFGHRLHNGAAIAAILTEALRLRGGAQVVRFPESEGMFPFAEGATDVAGALVQAFKMQPDVIVVISDGYENLHEGDAALVYRALARISKTRVLHVVPAFTERERVQDRAISGEIPTKAETLDAGLQAAWLRMRLALHPEAVEELLTQAGDELLMQLGPGKRASEAVKHRVAEST